MTTSHTGLLLHVFGGARGFIDGTALLGALAVADLLEGLVALLDRLLDSLLLEGDLAGLLEVLVADLLLGGGELCDVGVVALLHVLVGALQDGVLLDGLHGLLLLHAAEAGLGVVLAATKVDSSLHLSLTTLAAFTRRLASLGPAAAALATDLVGGGQGDNGQQNNDLQKSGFSLRAQVFSQLWRRHEILGSNLE